MFYFACVCFCFVVVVTVTKLTWTCRDFYIYLSLSSCIIYQCIYCIYFIPACFYVVRAFCVDGRDKNCKCNQHSKFEHVAITPVVMNTGYRPNRHLPMAVRCLSTFIVAFLVFAGAIIQVMQFTDCYFRNEESRVLAKVAGINLDQQCTIVYSNCRHTIGGLFVFVVVVVMSVFRFPIIVCIVRNIRAIIYVLRERSQNQFQVQSNPRVDKNQKKNKNCDVPETLVEDAPKSKKDKARSFHKTKVLVTPEMRFAEFEADVQRFRQVISRGVTEEQFGEKVNFPSKLKLGYTPVGRNLYSWLRNAQVSDIQSLLISALNVDQDGNQGDFFHTEYRRLVNQARNEWCQDHHCFIRAMSVIMAVYPMHIPTVFQHDTTYQMPEEYEFFSTVHYGLKNGELGKHAMSISFGEPNFLMQLFDHKIVYHTQSRIKGMVKTSMTHKEGSKNLQFILDMFDEYFPRMERCVSFNAKKKKITVTTSRALWFVNMFPREYFFMHHKGGDSALWDFFLSRVHSLKAQLENYVRVYYDVGQMTSEQRRHYFKARSKAFARIMGTPQYQSMFMAGIPSEDICELIYREEQHIINQQTERDSKVSRRFAERDKFKTKKIGKLRDIKYESLFQVESNPVVVYGAASVLALAFTYLTACVTTSVDDLRRQLTVNLNSTFGRVDNLLASVDQRVNDISTVVDTTISSWNLSSLISNPSPENKLFLLEVKSAIHLLIEMYCGTTYGIASWGSNFCITRSEKIISVFTTIAALVQPLNEQVEEEGEVVLQSQPAAQVFGSVAALLAKNSMGTFSSEDLRRANTEFTYLANLQKTTESNIKLVQGFVSVVCKLLFAFDPFDGGFQNFTYQLLEAIQFTEQWILTPPRTNDQFEQILTKYEQVKPLLVDPLMQQIPTYLRSTFLTKYQILENLASEASNILVGDVRRIEPVTLLVVGHAGSGKSNGLHVVKKCIANKLNNGKVENYTVLNSEYFEGYRNQMFVTMDDIFLSTDVKERNAEARNVINMTNSAPMSLNMAFGEKGKKYFNSQFILMTSNSLRPGDNVQCGITDPDAFTRRCHLHVIRDDHYTGDVLTNTFTVTRCIHFPEYVGREFNSGQLANLLLKIREVQVERYNQFNDGGEHEFNLDHPLFALESKPEFKGTVVTFSTTDYIKLFFNALGKTTTKWWDDGWVPWLVGIFLLLTTVGVGTYLWSVFGTFDHQSHDTRTKTRNPHANRNKQSRNQTLEYAGKKSRFSTQSSEVPDPLLGLSRCVVKFQAKYVSGYLPIDNTCVGHHIKNGLYAFPGHFFDDLIDTTLNEFKIHTHQGVFDVDFDPAKVLLVNNKDIVFCYFSLPQQPPEMYKFLIRDEDDSVAPNLGENCIYTLITRTDTVHRTLAAAATYSKPVSYETKERRYWIEDPIAYRADTAKGHSGGLVTFCDQKNKYHAIGMHVGKLNFPTYLAVAIPISQNFIDHIIGREGFQPQSLSFPYEVIRTVDKGVPIPTKSRIIRSQLFGYAGPPECIPARMSSFQDKNGDIIDPKFKALAKLQIEPTPPSPIPPCVKDAFFHHYPPRPEWQFILTIDQALVGIPEKGIASIDATTSPGYPYCLTSTKGKAPHVVTINGEHQYGPGTRAIIERYHEKLLDGTQIDVIWPDMLKDETRPVEKVEAGNTRLFSTCPLHFLILVRMYFGAFTAYLKTRAATHPISIGINPHSNHWAVLHDRFTAHDDEDWDFVAGDFRNYDGKVPRFVGEYFIGMVNDWYNDGPINARIRLLLAQHMHSATRLFETLVYQVNGGNTSGNPITGEYNSGCQYVMAYTIMKLDFGLSLGDFDLALYGDDNIMYMKRSRPHKLTAADLTEAYHRRFGIEYTHWSKQAVTPVDTIRDVSYLGRKFVSEHGKVLAPLELRTIVESCYWSKRAIEISPDLSLERIVNLANNMAMELSHHPHEVFIAEKQRFLDAVKERCSNITYELCCRAMLGRLTYHQKHYSSFSDW